MKRVLTVSVLLLAAYIMTSAQTSLHRDSTTVHSAVIVSNERNNAQNSSYEVMKAMYEANGRHFQDPRAPRFLFLDRKGRVALGIGGYVKATTSFDLGGIANNRDFVTATIPTPPQPDMRNQLQMDVSTSRLFFKLVGRSTAIGNFTVYIESDFRGAGNGYYGMRLRQAYIEMWRFKAGRSWSTFCDVTAAPPTIDFQGPSGSVVAMGTMIQYTQPINEHWKTVMAVEIPSATYTTNPIYNIAIKQRLPDFPSYTQFEWNGGKSHIRWSNIMRALSYRNLVDESNKFALGWATQLSGVVEFTPHFTLYFQGAYGNGYAHYMNDLSGYGYDLIPAERNGEMEAPYALGLVGGVKYTINPKLFMSAAYSQCRLFDKPTLATDAYHFAQYAVANIFYSPIHNCMIGVEYIYGNRHNYNNESGSAHRINAMVQYHF